MRSRTGCLTCRQRKLKCDEEKPICRRCVKSSRECRENPGSIFRHQHNASMNGESSSQTAVSTRFYTYKDTFKHNAVWLKIPSRVTFINTSNPYLDPPSPSSDTVPSCFEDMTALYERLSNASLQTSRNAHPIISTPTSANSVLHSLGVPVDFAPRSGIFPSYMQPPSSFAQEPLSTPPSYLYDLSACENVFRTTVPHSLPDVGWTSRHSRSPDFISQSSMTWSSAERPAYLRQDNYPRHESEIDFLLRHFSEGPGRWMDIFDTGAYFAAYVPVQARQSALLEHAAIACAARAFGRIKSHKSVREGDAPLYNGTKIHHSTRSVNWQRTAAENYGAAISLILGFLEENAIDTLKDPDCVFQDDGSDVDKVSNDPASRGECDTAERSSRVRSKDVLAALAILSMYEFLDGSTLEWVEHLKGAQFLFGLLQKPMKSLRMLSVGPSEVPTRWNFACNSRRAAFWNIVKQDMLAAYINRTGTRIDTEKFIMWREAGLPINGEGSLVAIVAANNDSRGCEGMVTESLLSNSLTWLMARLVNLLASLNPLSSETSATQTGIFSQTLSQYWWSLQRQFQSWHDGLPATFRPSTGSQLSHTMLPRSETDHRPIFYEVWYSTSLCASAKQLYHMGQILLHMSMPQTQTSDGYTMNYQLEPHPAACHVCQMHGREIIGIALAHLSGAVRINSVQPLFVAGQCLVDPREQQIVVDLLHEIERTVGWSTKDIVLQLVQQWQ